MNRGTTGVNSLPKTVTRQHHGCDLNPGPFCAWVQHTNHSATEPPGTQASCNSYSISWLCKCDKYYRENYFWLLKIMHNNVHENGNEMVTLSSTHNSPNTILHIAGWGRVNGPNTNTNIDKLNSYILTFMAYILQQINDHQNLITAKKKGFACYQQNKWISDCNWKAHNFLSAINVFS